MDIDLVRNATKGASVVYNFAGIADIEEASRKPIETIRQNILGNAHILDSIKKETIRRYVFASTVYVYSSTGSFYKDSKHACELYIEDYSKQYGIPYTILRYGSLYGPRADERNPINKLLKQAITEKKLSYWGDGEEIREYIHVEDAARCSVDILDENFVNQNVILTGHHPIKSRDLLVLINEIFGNTLQIEFNKDESELHYNVAPYSFNPRIGKKYVSHYYLDMGQGLLRSIEEIYKTYHLGKQK